MVGCFRWLMAIDVNETLIYTTDTSPKWYAPMCTCNAVQQYSSLLCGVSRQVSETETIAMMMIRPKSSAGMEIPKLLQDCILAVLLLLYREQYCCHRLLAVKPTN